MTQPDWDDDRLAEAFRARFDHPAPSTVARAVLAAIAGTTPRRFHVFERLQVRHVATAAVAVLLVCALSVALADVAHLGGGPSSPSGSGAVATTGASSTPTAQAVPGLVFDTLPIIHVSDAIEVRDAGTDDRELAVQGWFTYVAASCPAPMVKPTSPLQVGCPDGFMWLMEQAESLVSRSGNQTTFGSPSGPALNPDLDGIGGSWEFATQGLGASGDPLATDVVFVGHFDDRRAALCPEAEVDACRDRFVVDSVAIVSGVPQPRGVLRDVRQAGVAARSTEADIEAIVANEAPQAPILSMVVTDGAEGLVTIEPSLANGQQGLIDDAMVWVVRVLESERMVTYIVVDRTNAIYEMNQEGEAVNVGEPIATPEPWPPAGAVVIALTSPVGPNFPPAQVAVVDESGRLLHVTEKGSVHYSTTPSDGRFSAYAEPGFPGRVHLAWVGGICDSQITVTVGADLGSISFDMGPQVDCDSIGVGRELVLDFDGSVDVSAIDLSDVADPPAPVATSPAYQLDCGPLGPDTCERQAAALVAANMKAFPTKRIVSITFETECGSVTVLFDDGTGNGADIDCILP